MPEAYFFPGYQDQEGFENPSISGETFQPAWFGAPAFDVGRYFITRFADVHLPIGATITQARVIYTLNAKNPGTAQTINYSHWMEATTSFGDVIKQHTLPLKWYIYEFSARFWNRSANNAVFSWPSSPPDTYLEMYVDVSAALQQAWTTNSGRHMSLTAAMLAMAESQDLNVGNIASGRPPTLHITYTGGTAENSVVLINENPNFTRGMTLDTFPRPLGYTVNNFYGSYDDPDSETMASDGGIVAPMGGNICKITANQNKRMVFYLNNLNWTGYGSQRRLVPGEWLCLSAYVYVPANVERISMWAIPSIDHRSTTTVTDAWQRIYMYYQYSIDFGHFTGLLCETATPTAGQFWYLANVNLTRGRQLYTYFDGNTTDSATYHRTFDWGGGTTGKPNGGLAYAVIDNAPTANIVTPVPSGSTAGRVTTKWAYSDPYGENQSGFQVQMRKKRVQH